MKQWAATAQAIDGGKIRPPVEWNRGEPEWCMIDHFVLIAAPAGQGQILAIMGYLWERELPDGAPRPIEPQAGLVVV